MNNTRPDHVHRNTGMEHGPITFVINKNKSRTKLIGTSKCGFRSFAYVGDQMADAKRSIITDYNKRNEK